MKFNTTFTNKHFLAGLMFAMFGITAIATSMGYRFGSTARVGPGMFPLMIGVLLLILGGIMAVRAARGSFGYDRVETIGWRALVSVIASVLIFSALIRSVGLMAAVAASVAVVRLARPEGHWWEVLVLAAVLVGIASLVFKYVLNLSIPLVAW